MIIYNFTRIFKARGIDKPFTFLKKSGFSENFATKINKNKVKRIELREQERLCLLLRCTPNDFMEWIPDSQMMDDKEHPLNAIKRSDKVLDIIKTLNSVPLDKLEEIERIINDNIV